MAATDRRRRPELQPPVRHFRAMTDKPTTDRPGPLNPTTEGDDVVIHDPPEAAMHMSAEEADLSGIRLLDQAAKARERDNLQEPE